MSLAFIENDFEATGSGDEITLSEKAFVRISGGVGTLAVQVQKDDDLERSLSDSDFITIESFDVTATEAVVKKVETGKRLRHRLKCTAYTSGTIVGRLNA